MQKKKIVLIIDDNEGVRESLQKFLRLCGFEVYSADNGFSALNLLKKTTFDIIITDYSMPEMNGVELTRTAKSLYPDLLIIGISATCREKIFLNAGANAFFSKPIQLKELLSVCRSKV